LRINPIGGIRVKITVDSVHSANFCFSSKDILALGLRVYISSTLIYSFGIINLDTSFSDDDFWEGLKFSVKVINFRRVLISQNGLPPIPTKMVALKFLFPTLLGRIFVYKVLFKISPSILSLVICQNCLCYGHTAILCRSKSNCLHCGVSDHSIVSFPTKDTTDTSYFYCKSLSIMPRMVSPEKIKKIMVTDNVSFKDAIFILNNNIVNKSVFF